MSWGGHVEKHQGWGKGKAWVGALLFPLHRQGRVGRLRRGQFEKFQPSLENRAVSSSLVPDPGMIKQRSMLPRV